jgi:hypothetical protein
MFVDLITYPTFRIDQNLEQSSKQKQKEEKASDLKFSSESKVKLPSTES